MDIRQIGARALALHKAGRLAEALTDYDLVLAQRPDHAGTWNNRGSLLLAQARFEEALSSFDNALALLPSCGLHFNRAGALQAMDRFQDALAGYDAALALDPGMAEAWNNRGNVLQKLGRFGDAVASFDRALGCRPDYAEAHYNRGRALCEAGRTADGFAAFTRSAALFHASPQDGDAFPAHARRHAAEQQAYLGGAAQVGGVLYLDGGARIGGAAINPANAQDITRQWQVQRQQGRPQIVVIDNLLTPQALAALRRFCLGSTIWRTAYDDGYMGAFPESGFACPLLAQIGAEFRDTFPAIFQAHPLLYLWAFQYDSGLKGTGVHADSAAVNVNFWITPDQANLDPDHGGLVVWDKAAPLDWDFTHFNGDVAAARRFLADSGARPVTVPYRANRAVIFDSDLFHETDTIRFQDGFENRRINVTMLYGDRQKS